jgi:hypothetical protein
MFGKRHRANNELYAPRSESASARSARLARVPISARWHMRGTHLARAHKGLRAYALMNSHAWTNSLPAPQPIASYAAFAYFAPCALEESPAHGEHSLLSDTVSIPARRHPNPCLSGVDATDA